MAPGISGIAILISALAAGCAGGTPNTKTPDGEQRASAEKKPLSPAEIAERFTPAVVSVRTPGGLGTGFVIRPDGWIVTNLHVLAGADQVLVVLPNKQAYPVVEVINASAPHDLVVIKIDAKNLPTLTLSEDEVKAGEPVVAIGHPLGLEDTVSNGLVSAVRETEEITILQISAPIAPGSSGGPLFNDRGEVIGVATAILRGGQNLNLGLPVRYVQELVASPQPVPFERFAEMLNAAAAASRREARRERKIPHHATSIFAGCNDDALKLVYQSIRDAIAVGAPLYNDRKFAACYHIYEGAAADLERRLPKACKGPKRALGEGRKRAAKLNDPSDQAWAMRDAFDGILDALVRKIEERR